jgi:glycogen debranching enzyme
VLAKELFSGWGVRTLASTEARFNPMGYHTGAVWPHDNAIVAQGLARYGHHAEAARICDAMFDASLTFDGQRMPELFCGFAREPARSPVPYPLACAPQAWAAGAVLSLLQASLGLHVDGLRRRVVLTNPHLPGAVRELAIHGLRVHDEAVVDLSIFRHGRTVGVNVLRREGDVNVLLR